jgi:hypothetical protein
MNRLQEIDDELKTITPIIRELHTKVALLNKEKQEIIQTNCNHEFEEWEYPEFNEDNILIQEEICHKCGYIRKQKYKLQEINNE